MPGPERESTDTSHVSVDFPPTVSAQNLLKSCSILLKFAQILYYYSDYFSRSFFLSTYIYQFRFLLSPKSSSLLGSYIQSLTILYPSQSLKPTN